MNESDTRNEDNNVSSTEPTPEVETTSTEVASSAIPEEGTVIEPAVEETNTEPVAEVTEETTSEPVVETKEEETKEMGSENAPASTKDEEEGLTFSGMVAVVKAKWTKRYTYIVVAIIAALVVLAALLFVMERQGRIETGLFDGVHRFVDTKTTVAKVNDGTISKYDLDVSISQMQAGFAAQGADIESEEVKSEIQTRAIDMLVNTELLKQEAAAVGIDITDEDVEARLATLTTDVGGEAALKERMAEFNVSEKILRRDIKNELTIQALLDGVFKEKNIAVSEEEIVAFYNEAGGEKGGLPELEAVRPQIEQQLRSTKEQEAVTAYIEELRGKADIEVLI